jgi:lipid-A-disaccharide synthase
MAILYQSNPILWHLIGRWLIRTKHLSLVNILAARAVVSEFMPYFRSTDPIVRCIDELLQDRRWLEQTSNELIDLVEPMTQKDAGAEVARIGIEILRGERG